MFKIRPFQATEAEYARELDMHNAIWPDNPTAVENLKYDDSTRNPKYLFQKLVVELDDESNQPGTIIGLAWCGENEWEYEPGKYFVGFNVDPQFAQFEHSPAGVGNLVMEHLLTMLTRREPAARLLATEWREDKTERIMFLESHGFKQVMRFQNSELDVTAFDPGPFQDKLNQASTSGIEILSLTELKARHVDWLRRVYELDMEVLPDEPSPGKFTPLPIEEYAKIFSNPSFYEPGWFIAVDNDQYVGHSNIWNNLANPRRLYTGFTGVRRKYRRTGVATAIKVTVIEALKRQGITSLVTNNEENNPMYQINVRLGFKPLPAWLAFHKKIEVTA